MAKQKRRFTASSMGGSARPDVPRRSFRPAPDGPPPAQRPPAGSAPAPRPLTPARDVDGGGRGIMAALGAQRLVVGIAALAVVAAVLVLAVGWYQEFIAPRHELAMQVGDREYNMEYFARRYRMILGGTEANQAAVFGSAPEQTKTEISNESIALQRAHTLGITLTDAEIDQALAQRIGFPAASITAEDGSLMVTPSMQRALRPQLQETGLTLAQYRTMVAGQALVEKIQDYYAQTIASPQPQVRLRLIKLPSQSDAQISIDKVRGGERFEEIANAVSLDLSTKGRGGEREWLPKGILPSEIDAVAFDLPVNTLSQPISANNGQDWYVVEVLEKDAARELTEDQRTTLATASYTTWFDEQKSSMTIRDDISTDKLVWALEYTQPDSTTVSTSPNSDTNPNQAPIDVPIPSVVPVNPSDGQPAGDGQQPANPGSNP